MAVLTDAKYLSAREAILGEAYPGTAPLGGAPGYTLTRRQERLYVFRADLYAPVELDTTDSQAVADQAWAMEPTRARVPCWKRESQELNQASVVGRTNYDISLTIDLFTFPSGVEIDDGWLIKLYPLTPEILLGGDGSAPRPMQDAEDVQFYTVQGGPQDRPAVGRRQANERKVFAVKTSPPISRFGSLEAL